MTAPNNPTPEVERYELNHGEMMRSDDGEWYHKPQVDRVVEVLQAEESITRILLESEIADIRAIAGESRIALYDALKEANQRADAAAAAIASLTAELETVRKANDKLARQIVDDIEANKFLSERVAVLESALEPFARAMEFWDSHFPEASDDALCDAGDCTVGDLRLALAAREAK